MELEANVFKRRLREPRPQLGLWSTLGSPTAVEIIADSGFDWLLIDTEHAPNELPDVLAQLRAIRPGTASPVVRPAFNDPVLIKRLLDIGASSLLIPFVEHETEATSAVRATRYPPAGIRGVTGIGRASRYGRVTDYFARADDEICVLVQVETARAIDRIEAIAAVDGVDGVFVGPSDLAASLGHLGNPQHEAVQAVLRSAVTRIKAAGKPAGILAGHELQARRYLDWGYRFVAVGTDIGLLANSVRQLHDRCRDW
jgi:4-hydroxy-2-oxoheptanedioate aldolase